MAFRLIQGHTQDGMLVTEVSCDDHAENELSDYHLEEFGGGTTYSVYIELPPQGILNRPECTLCDREGQ